MTHSLFLVVLLGHIIGFAGAQPRAVLSLPSVFSDHMVLPAEPEVARVWGWTHPGDTVTLKIQFGNGSTLALPPVRSNSSSGRFEIAFTAAVSLAPSTIAIKNNNNTDTETTLQDVLFGTMILCGGQSNMQFSLRQTFNGSNEVAAADKYAHQIRLMTVERVLATKPSEGPALPRLSQKWSVASKAAVDDGKSFGIFSAECWLVGRRLADARPGTPIGMVSSCWSGSMIQPWLPAAGFARCPNAAAKGNGAPFSDSQMFNAMIYPLRSFAFSGVIWHQGEENSGDPVDYKCYFQALIASWRAPSVFGIEELPLAFVQLQPCGIPPEQRFAQAQALTLPNVAMATAIDLGDPGPTVYHGTPYPTNPDGECHTRYKVEISNRLAPALAGMMWANVTAVPTPTVAVTTASYTPKDYRTYTISVPVQGDVGGGLSWQGTPQCKHCCDAITTPLTYLSTAGVWAGRNVVPSKKGGSWAYNNLTRALVGAVGVEPPFAPTALRYAWSDFEECLLMNGNGVPLAPFNITLHP